MPQIYANTSMTLMKMYASVMPDALATTYSARSRKEDLVTIFCLQLPQWKAVAFHE
jgi:hypothetical protein